MNLLQLTRELRDSLEAEADLNVAIDPRDAQIPGVIISPASLEYDRLSHESGTATFDVVFAAGYDVETALDDLGRMIGRVAAVAHLTEIRSAVLQDPNIGADPLPAFTAKLTTEWSTT